MCPSKYEKIIAIDVPFENARERAYLTCGSRMVGEVTPAKLGENPRNVSNR
jgi:hypothetical protein